MTLTKTSCMTAAEVEHCIEQAGMVPSKTDQTQLHQAMQSMVRHGVEEKGIDYSLEEQWTGRYWVDGKKIYQKTLALGPIPTTPTTQHTSMGVTNIDTVIDFWGIAKKENAAFLHLPRVAPDIPGMIECYVEQTTLDNPCLVLITTSSGGGYIPVKESFMTVQYTCTDR